MWASRSQQAACKGLTYDADDDAGCASEPGGASQAVRDDCVALGDHDAVHAVLGRLVGGRGIAVLGQQVPVIRRAETPKSAVQVCTAVKGKGRQQEGWGALINALDERDMQLQGCSDTMCMPTGFGPFLAVSHCTDLPGTAGCAGVGK